jgi:hypothetical protein
MPAISQGVQSGRGSNRSARSPPVTASALTTWFVPAYQGQWSSVFLILACISKPRCFRPPCKTRQGYYHKCMGSELNRRANSPGGKIKTKIHQKLPSASCSPALAASAVFQSCQDPIAVGVQTGTYALLPWELQD